MFLIKSPSLIKWQTNAHNYFPKRKTEFKLELIKLKLNLISFWQILPGIKLGVMAVDSCDSPHHALEQTVDFIKVSLGTFGSQVGLEFWFSVQVESN